MANDRKAILRERVKSRLETLGKTAHEVSVAIEANRGYVRDLLDPEKTSMPSGDRMNRLAVELETTTDYLLGESDMDGQVRSEVSLRDVRPGWNGQEPAGPPIPLVGTGDCADLELCDTSGNMVAVERSSFDPDYHVRYIARPPALLGARDLYAIEFHGDSMEPRFEAGEVGIVDPARAARPRDYVVVQLTNGDTDEVGGVLVKRLVRQNSEEIELEQFNPPLVFTLARARVKRMHRIVDLVFG